VRDGSVDGWSWTGGEPGLPSASLADVAEVVGAGVRNADAAGSTPLVTTVLPVGFEPAGESGQGWLVYAGAAAVLVAIGAGSVYGARRRRRVEHPPEELAA
jgi:LPXTG-motif cell wall-anchored protein